MYFLLINVFYLCSHLFLLTAAISCTAGWRGNCAAEVGPLISMQLTLEADLRASGGLLEDSDQASSLSKTSGVILS